jgi:hypothetical protein
MKPKETQQEATLLVLNGKIFLWILNVLIVELEKEIPTCGRN